MILDKLILLKFILTERLPQITRWSKVGIFFHGDKFPPDTVNESNTAQGSFYIVWYSRKRPENPNPYEYKEVPLNLADINALIKRQREKFRTDSPNS